MSEQLYKWLNGTQSTHGGWGEWRKGRWRSVRGELVPCANGLHLCREHDLVSWIAPSLWLAEHDGEMVDADDKVVVRRARVVERLDGWNERTARLFAADCAERVLPLFEAKHPQDDRPRKAIEAARAFANGLISGDELAWAAEAAEAAWAAEAAEAAEDAEAAEAAGAAWAAWVVGAARVAWVVGAARAAEVARVARAARAARAAEVAWAARAARVAGVARAAEAEEHEWQTARLLDYAYGGVG